jgi:hypothetical protein
VHDQTDSYATEFLARDVETRNQLMASAEWSWRRFVRIKAEAGWLWVETFQGKPGVDLSTPALSGELYFRY